MLTTLLLCIRNGARVDGTYLFATPAGGDAATTAQQQREIVPSAPSEEPGEDSIPSAPGAESAVVTVSPEQALEELDSSAVNAVKTLAVCPWPFSRNVANKVVEIACFEAAANPIDSARECVEVAVNAGAIQSDADSDLVMIIYAVLWCLLINDDCFVEMLLTIACWCAIVSILLLL